MAANSDHMEAKKCVFREELGSAHLLVPLSDNMSPNAVRISELCGENERQAERHRGTERELQSVSQGILKLVSLCHLGYTVKLVLITCKIL